MRWDPKSQRGNKQTTQTGRLHRPSHQGKGRSESLQQLKDFKGKRPSLIKQLIFGLQTFINNALVFKPPDKALKEGGEDKEILPASMNFPVSCYPPLACATISATSSLSRVHQH